METIERVENNKRGFGTCTMALYRDKNNNWDYIECCKPTNSDYQRDIRCIEEPQRLVGKTLSQIRKMKGVEVIRGKWHTPTITEEGIITSLIC